MADGIDESNFVPRPYQDQLLEIVMEKNTIIYLPTGILLSSPLSFLSKILIYSPRRWENFDRCHGY